MCPYCTKQPKTWEGSDPRCAFPTEDSEFGDNWNCAALSLLREYCDKFYVETFDHDQWQGIIPLKGMLEFPDEELVGLWITWYKTRGATDMVLLMYSDKMPKKPTWKEMDVILQHLINKHGDPKKAKLSDKQFIY